ncbi:hypothetical protein YC2023_080877 [Brassica napus]
MSRPWSQDQNQLIIQINQQLEKVLPVLNIMSFLNGDYVPVNIGFIQAINSQKQERHGWKDNKRKTVHSLQDTFPATPHQSSQQDFQHDINNLHNVIGQALRFPEVSNVNSAARDLIKGLLVKEPRKRSRMSEARQRSSSIRFSKDKETMAGGGDEGKKSNNHPSSHHDPDYIDFEYF